MHSDDASCQVKRQYVQSINYIESMLRQQLIAAIGKQVTPDDFADYMRFHNNKLFNQEFKPKPCCYSIRRTEEHSPQGVVSIERKPDQGDAIAEPISTIVHHSEASAEMKVATHVIRMNLHERVYRCGSLLPQR